MGEVFGCIELDFMKNSSSSFTFWRYGLCLVLFSPIKFKGTVNWMAGGFSGASWKHVTMILPYTIIGLVGVSISSKLLNALQLGDDVAKSLGTRVEATRFFLVTLAALLAASAVSVAGMLTFVGLIVPHMMRLVVGSDFNYLLHQVQLFLVEFY